MKVKSCHSHHFQTDMYYLTRQGGDWSGGQIHRINIRDLQEGVAKLRTAG